MLLASSKILNKKLSMHESVGTEMLMKSSVFWDTTPCNVLKVN
jgi:hypothetical protein